MKRRLRLGRVVLTLLCACCLVWFVASFINVNLANDPFGASYGELASWNLFNLFN